MFQHLGETSVACVANNAGVATPSFPAVPINRAVRVICACVTAVYGMIRTNSLQQRKEEQEPPAVWT
eukprot:CAMPEP_0194053958 /NCGR_PEP_ID=MMETSP0009_2-20130614/51960_1 /TAXON_ID=210454 /ORGANISM="Grammatophora oceanica, Strain CCMP 410" /LENGTH=66 /DNA_ID=CAMNT_0038702287 /DNA_START=18 /DNA_END=214 /DNA_ORIENTATION=+